ANSRFAKAGVSCFYESEVLNSSFVHLMKFSAENPAFAKRQTVSSKFRKTPRQKNLFPNKETFIFTETFNKCRHQNLKLSF
ncbi:hypothetical protein CHX27_01635, partial [Flavobacterium aurantiibacter]